MRCIGCRACCETRPFGALVSYQESLRWHRKSLILRRLVKRGLEGRTMFFESYIRASLAANSRLLQWMRDGNEGEVLLVPGK